MFGRAADTILGTVNFLKPRMYVDREMGTADSRMYVDREMGTADSRMHAEA
jgi:hypothetical protein